MSTINRIANCPLTSIVSKTSSSSSAASNVVNNLINSSSSSEKVSSSSITPLIVHHQSALIKSFDKIPTPRRLPLLGTTLDLIASGGAPFLHEYCDRRHKSLGRIYREQLGNLDCVFIADADLMQLVYSNEGQYPVHAVPEPWTIFNDMKGIRRGLFFMDGPEWSTRRKSLNRIFLRKDTISGYEEQFNGVISDLLSRWSSMSSSAANSTKFEYSKGLKVNENENNFFLPDLERELYNWSIESLGTMIFGRRLGCVTSQQHGNNHSHSHNNSSNSKVETIHEFVQCIQQLFVESAHMTIIPAKLAYTLNLPVWRRFVVAAEKALSLARDYVEDNVKQVFLSGNIGNSNISSSRNQLSKCPFSSSSISNQQKGVLQLLTTKEQIEKDEVVNIITDLFLAAADTTSHATQWALYLLARNPECQERMYLEVTRVLHHHRHHSHRHSTNDNLNYEDNDESGVIVPREEHLAHMPYVKGVIKESLRLYPVAPFLSRVLDRDIVLDRYRIPAGKMIVMSLYTAGRDPEYYPDPESFRPERWLRTLHGSKSSSNKLQFVRQPNAFIPFGVGVRSCIGRRVAELQMQLLLSRIIQKFRLSMATEREVGIKLRMITTPEQPIQLLLHPRHS